MEIFKKVHESANLGDEINNLSFEANFQIILLM